MTRNRVRVTAATLAMVVCCAGVARSQGTAASWLDEPQPEPWNQPRLPIPAATRVQEGADHRCRALARPPQLDEDERLHEQGWDLVGPFQGGWQMLVIRGTAGYDGMCRPRQFQDFVFLRGAFAGTLSPRAMDSRSDGALRRVSLQGPSRLMAEYDRYAATDPLCCPSRTTIVVFDVPSDGQALRPVSVSTTGR